MKKDIYGVEYDERGTFAERVKKLLTKDDNETTRQLAETQEQLTKTKLAYQVCRDERDTLKQRVEELEKLTAGASPRDLLLMEMRLIYKASENAFDYSHYDYLEKAERALSHLATVLSILPEPCAKGACRKAGEEN